MFILNLKEVFELVFKNEHSTLISRKNSYLLLPSTCLCESPCALRAPSRSTQSQYSIAFDISRVLYRISQNPNKGQPQLVRILGFLLYKETGCPELVWTVSQDFYCRSWLDFTFAQSEIPTILELRGLELGKPVTLVVTENSGVTLKKNGIEYLNAEYGILRIVQSLALTNDSIRKGFWIPKLRNKF
ncbi:hypothetical protein AVEN_155077-1 [Araneus ventricosus]|uniref:Uncharacterized protein n=1 Tax=Araneus ventricosus TaxID=182803 RepID=A0A4Y2A7W6_ARAVE|nr:hypothetical protein AVEN_155077-1 [Araneus ventricosus]